MVGFNDVLLGALAPMAAAGVAFSVAWLIARRAGPAWTAGVVVGFAAGMVGLESRTLAFSDALWKLVRPTQSLEWTPLVGLAAAAPGLAAWALGSRRWVAWALAVPLCIAAPLWLLWGGRYLPSMELREAGFAEGAWSQRQAALILGGMGASIAASWRLWEACPATTPRVRTLLVVAALAAAAGTTALTGSLTYGQYVGALAAAVGGSACAGVLLRVKAGPEAAAGPVLLVAGCLLISAVCYSSTEPIYAAGLWAGLTVASSWLPGSHRVGRWQLNTARALLCLVPLGAVVWQAKNEFDAAQRQAAEEAESNPYLQFK